MLLSERGRATSPRTTQTHRRADIQGIRAIAVLLVVLFHAGIGPAGGFTGVDVFFVVSGFVIASLLMRELTATGGISLRTFYLRRIRRLLPALALVSVVTVACGALLMSPLGGYQRTLGLGVISTTGFVANAYYFKALGGYFQQTADSNPFLHTWTLSVEEQFYLVFPLLLLTGWWLSRRRGPRWLAGLLLAGLVLSLACDLALTFDWVPHLPGLLRSLSSPDVAARAAFYLPVSRAWEFLAGALAALAASRWTPRYRLATPLAWCGVVALTVGVFCIQPTQPFPGILAVVPVTATVCLLLAGSTTDQASGVTRLLSTRPAVVLGDLSYSWYLWHWPAIVMAQTLAPGTAWVVVAAFGSLAPAALSYRFVERPIHRGQILVSRRATAILTAVCLAVPVAAGGALVIAARRSWDQPGIAAIEADVGPEHLDEVTGCAVPFPLGSPYRPSCTWAVPHARGTILLTGDSNAGQLTEPVLAATRRLRYDMQVATYGGCPLLVRPSYFDSSCRQFVQGTVAAIKARRAPYAAVVLSNASDAYVAGPLMSDFAADAPAGATGSLRQRAIAGWVQDLRRTLRALGHRQPILVIGAVPQFPNVPICLKPSIFRRPTADCGWLSPAVAAQRRTHLITAEEPVVAALGADYLNTGRILCRPDGGCSAFVHGHLVYRDGAHLSVTGSMLFEPSLKAALHKLTRRASRAAGRSNPLSRHPRAPGHQRVS
jgi:peptidoglycan/LPS O-acetylase OafA/YrhL